VLLTLKAPISTIKRKLSVLVGETKIVEKREIPKVVVVAILIANVMLSTGAVETAIVM
jgi:hypothetical protein